LEQVSGFVIFSALIFIPVELIGYLCKCWYIFQFSRNPDVSVFYTRYFAFGDATLFFSYLLGFIHIAELSSRSLAVWFLVLIYVGSGMIIWIVYMAWKKADPNTNLTFLADHLMDTSALLFEIIMFFHLALGCRNSVVFGMKVFTRCLSILWTHISLIPFKGKQQYSQIK
jgi:hypothetical protein